MFWKFPLHFHASGCYNHVMENGDDMLEFRNRARIQQDNVEKTTDFFPDSFPIKLPMNVLK